VPGWQANNWRTSTKQPVKNIDLWQQLILAAQPHQVDWQWIKGHAGHPGNELADQLATQGLREAIAAAELNKPATNTVSLASGENSESKRMTETRLF
jgi:ribonuclease HI